MSADAAAGSTAAAGALRVRPVEEGDFDRGLLALLAQLTVVGDVSRETFARRVREMASGPEHILVVQDDATGALVGCGTLLLERKLIRGAGVAGHIEDVVVDASARGRGLGKLLLDALVARARQAGCYKVILDCTEANSAFYAKCGFVRKEVQMACYL